ELAMTASFLISLRSVRRASRGRSSCRKPVRRFLIFDCLEDRTLPSGSGIHPGYVIMHPAGASPAGSPTPVKSAFTPAAIKQAYGIGQVAGDGTGQTIAIVDAYDDPNLVSRSSSLPIDSDTGFLSSDLHQFDVQYSLPEPAGFFTKVDQTGGNT